MKTFPWLSPPPPAALPKSSCHCLSCISLQPGDSSSAAVSCSTLTPGGSTRSCSQRFRPCWDRVRGQVCRLQQGTIAASKPAMLVKTPAKLGDFSDTWHGDWSSWHEDGQPGQEAASVSEEEEWAWYMDIREQKEPANSWSVASAQP